MKTSEPRALLIGENSQGSSHLVKLLEGHGCECSFATSYQEACSLLGTQPFDLVLSPMRLRDCSVFPLVSLLDGSDVTLFYYQLVEDGCWWLPALRSGQKCFGSQALRPSEFVVSLNEVIAEIRSGSRVAAEDQPTLVSATQTSVATLSRSGSGTRPTAARVGRFENPEFAGRRAVR